MVKAAKKGGAGIVEALWAGTAVFAATKAKSYSGFITSLVIYSIVLIIVLAAATWVMKALGIASAADLDVLADYAPVVDRFLLDAKAPPGAPLPGGNAAPFDWTLTAGRTIPRPWLLAGGLTPENVGQAIAVSGAPGVDVSSGVERARGVKDPARIAAFVAASRAA